MIEDKGSIVSIDITKGIAVKVEGVEECEICAIKANCGQKRGDILYLPFKEGFTIGDRVKIKIISVSLLNASVFIYLIPLVLFIIGILFSYLILFSKYQELERASFSFLIGIVILFPYGLLLRIYDKKKQKKIKYEIEKIE
ncbi:MAG TPA: SoxR reducing system RseC family protein [Exilispira sp.]|nr:SoxR reducing system RseC family protein [Exilispira sp.]